MPHDVRYRTQHVMVRTTCLAIAAGRVGRGKPRKCEALLGCTCEQLVQRLGICANDPRELDHIVPLSQGGDEHFTNLRMLDAAQHRARAATASPDEQAAVALLRLKYCSGVP